MADKLKAKDYGIALTFPVKYDNRKSEGKNVLIIWKKKTVKKERV